MSNESYKMILRIKLFFIAAGDTALEYNDVLVISEISTDEGCYAMSILNKEGELVFKFTKDKLYPKAPMRQTLLETQFNFDDFIYNNHPIKHVVFKCNNEQDNSALELWYDDIDMLRILYTPHETMHDESICEGSQRPQTT